MTDREHPPSREDVAARLAKADAERDAEHMRQESRRAAGTAQSLGFRIAIELLAALIVGGAMGYFLDRWLKTAPIFLVVMLVLGFAAGLMSVFRAMQGLDQAVGLGRAMREADRSGKSLPPKS